MHIAFSVSCHQIGTTSQTRFLTVPNVRHKLSLGTGSTATISSELHLAHGDTQGRQHLRIGHFQVPLLPHTVPFPFENSSLGTKCQIVLHDKVNAKDHGLVQIPDHVKLVPSFLLANCHLELIAPLDLQILATS